MKHTSLKLLPALIAAAFSGGASASAFQLMEQNASGLGNAYAGSAANAENASVIFYNPAAMTQLKDREVSVGVNFIKPGFKFHDQGSTSSLPDRSGGDAGNMGILPNAYLSWRLSDRFTAGIGFGAPFGLMTEYGDPWTGGAHSNKFDIKTYNINPSLAFKVNEVVSLGLGISWQRFEATYKRTYAAGSMTVGQLPPAMGGYPVVTDAGMLTSVKLDADDDAWGWNIGALFNITPETKLGVSYRAKIDYTLSGSIKASGSLVDGGAATYVPALGGMVVGAMPAGAAPGSMPAKAKLTTPDTFILSGTHQLTDRWLLAADVSWTGWSSIQDIKIKSNGQEVQQIDTKFRDTWRVALGGTYTINDAWKWKLGAAYDETPIKSKENRLVSLPDNDRYWLSTGAQWKPTRDSALDLGVSYMYLKNAGIDNDQSAEGRGRVKGYYKDKGWIVGLQYSLSF